MNESPFDEEKDLKRRRWIIAGIFCVAFVVGVTAIYQNHHSPTPNLEIAHAETTQSPSESPSIDSPGSSSAADQAPPGPTRCHNGFARVLHKTAETRKEHTDEVSRGFESEFGINATVAGEDNQILIFYGPPSAVGSLREQILPMRFQADIEADLCANGFDEVQVITKADDETQTLISKWEIDPEFLTKLIRSHVVNPM